MRILITGHTGTLGKQATQLLLEDCHQVVGYSRGELLQSQLPWKHKIVQYIGDVRDTDRLVEAARDCDMIFHFAAMKHIDKVEENPEEGFKTNIMGTDSVLHAQRILGIPKVILSSTDKACMPVNAYGASKLIAERMVLRNSHNVVCRWGNVISSRGSVIPEFVRSIKEEKLIRITDKRMTRFFIKAESVAVFLYIESQKTIGGLRIPEMKAYPVLPMGLMIGKILGITPNIIEIGTRPGEKLHEDLRTSDEGGHINSGNREYWYKEDELETLLREVIEEK